MLLVVGLGNPGRGYASHRHNVGFMAIDELASKVSADAFREKFSGMYARARLGEEQAVLLKPMTYMNESGRSVQPAMAFFKATPRELIVIHDELDLPFGDVRVKFGGGHAGHNGLRSIIAHVGTGDFGRVRFGIGRPTGGLGAERGSSARSPQASTALGAERGSSARSPQASTAFQGEPADFVLSSFDPSERASLPDSLKVVTESVLDIAARGFDAAMNVRNTRPKQAKP
jgi:PTH1 family peptidyl-tRNA hydrolase